MCKVTNSPEEKISELADAAFEQATLSVNERAEQTGTPVIVSENGQVIRLTPQTVRERIAKRSDGSHVDDD